MDTTSLADYMKRRWFNPEGCRSVCWWCAGKVESPIPVAAKVTNPHPVSGRILWTPRGVFCRPECGLAWVKDNKARRFDDVANTRLMWKEYLDIPVSDEIVPALPREKQPAFGAKSVPEKGAISRTSRPNPLVIIRSHRALKVLVDKADGDYHPELRKRQQSMLKNGHVVNYDNTKIFRHRKK